MRTYVCETCRDRFEASARGRLPKYCPGHREAAYKTAERSYDAKRLKYGRDVAVMLAALGRQCCADAKKYSPRKKVCDQHQWWFKWLRSDAAKTRFHDDFSHALARVELQRFNDEQARVDERIDSELAARKEQF